MDTAYRLIRDLVTVVFDALDWLWRALWRVNRRLVRVLLPGQSRPVHGLVAAVAVVAEFVGLFTAAVHLASRSG